MFKEKLVRTCTRGLNPIALLDVPRLELRSRNSLFDAHETFLHPRSLSSNPKSNETIQGKIVRSGYVPPVQNDPEMGYMPQTVQSTQPIIEVRSKLQFGLPGQPIFPSLGLTRS
jgi:hypothetical protein